MTTTLATQQLNNGRFRVIAADYNYNRFAHNTVLAILWRTFATENDAQQFIATITAKR